MVPPQAHRWLAAAAVVVALAAAPCRAGDPTPVDEVLVVLPDGYDPMTPAPLVIQLHGYTSNGPASYAFHGFGDEANARGYVVAAPTGSVDPNGAPYWNATDNCCDFFGEAPDHVGYLESLIDHLEATYAIDPDRIHLLGYSNGAHMCFRMACDASHRLASVVPIAGETFNDPALCGLAGPIQILYIIGTADAAYPPAPGFPGASGTVAQWSGFLGCDSGEADPVPLDAIVNVPFAETQRRTYVGCDPGTALDYWQVVGGRHLMSFTDAGKAAIFDFLDDHPRAPACAADVTGDGIVGIDDVIAVILDWGPCPGCPTDVDGNDAIDVDDVVAVILAFGPCPGA